MKLIICFVLCGVVLGGRMAYAEEYDCPFECKCNNTDVECTGTSIVNVTAKLPNDTLSYTYTAIETEIKFGLVDFSHLQNLTLLCINSANDELLISRTLLLSASQQSVFKPLRNLRNLGIHASWNLSRPMPEMFSYLPNLRVLDLSFSVLINYAVLRESFSGFQNNCVLDTLLLGRTQSLNILQNGLSFNLSSFLEPLAHCPLKTLDLSYNCLKIVYPGLLKFAPKLETLNFTHNLLTPHPTAFIFELALHPTLVTADFSKQGMGAKIPNVPRDSSQSHAMTLPHIQSKPAPEKIEILASASEQTGCEIAKTNPSQGKPPFTQLSRDASSILQDKLIRALTPTLSAACPLSDIKMCVKQVTVDVCNMFQSYCNLIWDLLKFDHPLFCCMLSILSADLFGGIPCKYIPNITDLLANESECGGCLRYPTTGNGRIVKFDGNVYYDQILLPAKLTNKTNCLYPNKVEYLGLSNNYPFGVSDLNDILQTPVTGFGKLKVLQLAGCGLKRPYFNITGTLPSLEEFDLSNNKIDLEADSVHRYFIGSPTVKVFHLTANGIVMTPENTLQTMTALEELHLDQNLLQEFTMDLTKLPRLVLLNLKGNLITTISKNMMAQFDAHAQRVNRTVQIDLRGNRLLCTCKEREFVRWLQADKHHNLQFVGMSNVTCLNDQSKLINIIDVNLRDMALRCLSVSVSASIGAGATVILTVLVAAFGTCVYRKRWWFRYRYYIAARMYRQQQHREQAHRDYRYDAFVSYNSRDELWINETLQPKLEDELGLKLCLHERDFEFGRNIMEQISESIENSRKTLLILSPNFLASTWCHWEMNLAQNHLFTSGQDVLLLAILSPMSKVKMSRVLKDLLETKTYVTWTDDPDGQKLFWEKLHQAIRAERIEYDLEDGPSSADTRPLVVNEQAGGTN